MRKKILSVVLLFSIILSLIACGNNSFDNSAEQNKMTENEITVLAKQHLNKYDDTFCDFSCNGRYVNCKSDKYGSLVTVFVENENSIKDNYFHYEWDDEATYYVEDCMVANNIGTKAFVSFIYQNLPVSFPENGGFVDYIETGNCEVSATIILYENASEKAIEDAVNTLYTWKDTSNGLYGEFNFIYVEDVEVEDITRGDIAMNRLSDKIVTDITYVINQNGEVSKGTDSE